MLRHLLCCGLFLGLGIFPKDLSAVEDPWHADVPALVDRVEALSQAGEISAARSVLAVLLTRKGGGVPDKTDRLIVSGVHCFKLMGRLIAQGLMKALPIR
jgi:hypothetical protein